MNAGIQRSSAILFGEWTTTTPFVEVIDALLSQKRFDRITKNPDDPVIDEIQGIVGASGTLCKNSAKYLSLSRWFFPS